MEGAIVVEGLTRKFGDIVAIDGVSFRVGKGEICGFLGPNGAGKTTTIRILAGLLKPTSGFARVLGFDVVADRQRAQRRLGYMPEACRFPGHLSAEELLDYYAKLFDIPKNEREARIDHLVGLVGLTGRARDRIVTYSKGMVQRLGVAQALINSPDVLIMDEPTRGLDPAAIVEFRHLIRRLPEEGVTVLVSSHILSEVERVCTTLAIINEGRLVAFGDRETLVDGSSPSSVSVIDIELTGDIDAVASALSRLEFVQELELDCNFIQVILSTKEDVRHIISKTIFENGGFPLEISRSKTALEKLYLQLTGGA